jgi:Spy/CpxP family protein refolding chaperone
METNLRNKWQIRLAVLLIFAIGFIAGALTMNVYRARRTTASPADNHRGRFERVMDQLNLSDEQRDQVKAIFDDARARLIQLRKESGPKFREVREQTDTRLREVLTPEQWEQFQKLTSEHRDRRSRRGRRDKTP